MPQHKILLDEAEMPTRWYNLVADLPSPPPPPLHPGTHEPVGPEAFAPLFPMALIEQEVTTDRFVDIPEAVLDVYKLWRPSPLYRAHNLERALGTPAKIYYKYEGVSPAGSHKPNTAVPQAYYNAQAGVKKLTTETGAGQWGTALAFACALFGLECEVWQVGASYDQKPYRRMMIEAFGATVHRSPSALTEAGRAVLAERRRPPRLARHRHQRGGRDGGPGPRGPLRAGQRAQPRAAAPDDHRRGGPAPAGQGRRHPRRHRRLHRRRVELRRARRSRSCARSSRAGWTRSIRAVEPASCPSLTRGVYAYDFGDTAGLTPLMKMHTLGHDFVPDPIHAGGLRYHGMSPLISHVYELGMMEAISVPQTESFAAGLQFARTEGILPAPEPTHALAACIREALACKESGEEKVILTALCGHGHFDLAAYDAYLSGRMTDEDVSVDRLRAGLATVPAL